jgi:hypothetical protein
MPDELLERKERKTTFSEHFIDKNWPSKSNTLR